MYYAKIKFDKIPELGFAMTHYNKSYSATYGRSKKKRIEVAYINSGTVKLKLYEKEMIATEGSVVVIFRHLPVSIATVGDKIYSHYTVLGEFEDYDFQLVTDEICADDGRFVIPFVTPPCAECEEIGRKVCSIARDMEEDREKSAFSSAVEFLSIIKELSAIYQKSSPPISKANKMISSAVCSYVEDNIYKPITLEQLSRHIGKSPNHIGVSFKKENNMTVKEYVNIKKVKTVADVMQNRKLSFRQACECVAISDEAYGYRLFKRYMGITPGEYTKIRKI